MISGNKVAVAVKVVLATIPINSGDSQPKMMLKLAFSFALSALGKVTDMSALTVTKLGSGRFSME